MYVLVWESRPKAGKEREFELAYGPRGDWVALFRGDPAHRGTDLLRDPRDPRRYLTVDRWESLEAYEAFRESRRAEYEALDRRLEALTESETAIGGFVSVPAGD